MLLLLIWTCVAVDLTTLYLDESYFYNRTQQFKIALQADAQTKPLINPIPDNPKSEENRMKQILYEQEDMNRKQVKLVVREIPPEEKKEQELYGDEIDNSPKPMWPPDKAPKKSLQRDMIDGKQADKIEEIVDTAQEHKVIIISFLMIILSLLVLMRESYGKNLHKIYRKYLWKIAMNGLGLQFIVILGVSLYYNNYFDEIFLESQSVRKVVKSSIILININEYDEVYTVDVFSYFLISGFFTMILHLINTIYVYRFNNQLLRQQIYEKNWQKKQALHDLYLQQQNELQEIINDLDKYGHDLNPQLKEDMLFKKDKSQKNIQTMENTFDFLLYKLQFHQHILPYIGPSTIDESFIYCEYLARITGQTIYKISEWDTFSLVSILISVGLFLSQVALIKLAASMIIFSALLFYFVIDMNTRIEIILRNSLIDRDYHQLAQDDITSKIQFLEKFNGDMFDLPVDPQTLMFPFRSKQFYLMCISYLQKFTTIFLLLCFIYLYFWSGYLWYTKLILIIIVFLVWISTLMITKNIIEQFAIATSIFIKDHKLIRQTCLQQKKDLMMASQSFYEYIRYLRKGFLSDAFTKEQLIILRPQIIDVLESCGKYFTNQEVIKDNQYQYLQQIGLQKIYMINIKNFNRIIKALGYNLNKFEYSQLKQYCQSDDQKFFSPIKLIFYIQGRIDELSLSPTYIIHEVLDKLINSKYPPPEDFDGVNDEHYKDQQMVGNLPINLLQQFLITAGKIGFMDQKDVDCLYDHFEQFQPEASYDRIAQFINSQITQMPR
ncbi:hypothetical protein pb186bvf_001675 [Paramecium bursaria]